MSLSELIDMMIREGKSIPWVSSAIHGDAYDIWNTGEIRYSSLVISVRSIERDVNTVRYNFIIYYGDRLLQDSSNKVSVWQDASSALQDFINKIDNEEITVERPYTIQLFEQKFLDLLAGAYVELYINTESELGNCDVTIEEETYSDINEQGPTSH